MGREGKSGWGAIRAVLGVGLLVPGTTGYSLIQVFVMWVVIQGVGLADTIWETGANYMFSHQGRIFSNPGSGNIDQNDIAEHGAK